jgi:hypothetical protein
LVGHSENSSGAVGVAASLEQIQQREQENPNQVDKMPIKSNILDHVGAFAIKFVEQDYGERNQADNHMDGMEAG